MSKNETLKKLVSAFLGEERAINFNIESRPAFNESAEPNSTSLFNAQQTKELFDFMLKKD